MNRQRTCSTPMSLLDYARIAALRVSPMPDDASLLDDSRVIGRAKSYTVVYGPFSSQPNPQAEVIFVGLTPGRSQLELANRIARERVTLTPEEYALTLRREVAFAGPMRRNLIAMLDRLGLQRRLGLPSTADLFGTQSHRMFATSALRYPVFGAGWKNYSGNSAIVREPLFIEMLKTLLGPMLAAMPRTLIVPFGSCVGAGVLYVAECGMIDKRRVLRGFPHPSGANGHRRVIFENNAQSMKGQLSRWFSSVGERE
jgi:hypothetical protein